MQPFTELMRSFRAVIKKYNVSLSELKIIIERLPEFVEDIREKNKTILSNLFQITNTYEISASDKEFDGEKVESFLDPVKKAVKSSGKIFYFYNDIQDLLKGVKIKEHASIKYTVYRFLKKLTFQQIFDGTKLHNIYTTDDVYVACEKVIDIFRNGEVLAKNTGVFVPFMIGDVLCRVLVCRLFHGHVSVHLCRVFFDGELNAGDAVGFSDKPLKS